MKHNEDWGQLTPGLSSELCWQITNRLLGRSILTRIRKKNRRFEQEYLKNETIGKLVKILSNFCSFNAQRCTTEYSNVSSKNLPKIASKGTQVVIILSIEF